MNIGDFLKKKRKEKNLSIRQLAELANCHYSTIQKYENNIIKLKGESFFKILSVLDLTELEKKKIEHLTCNIDIISKKNNVTINNITLNFSGLTKEEIKKIQSYIDYIRYQKRKF